MASNAMYSWMRRRTVGRLCAYAESVVVMDGAGLSAQVERHAMGDPGADSRVSPARSTPGWRSMSSSV